MFDWLRPRQVVKNITVNADIRPCVVSPGDVVLIADHRWYETGPEVGKRVRELLAPHLPDGVRVVSWPADQGRHHINLSKLFELFEEVIGQAAANSRRKCNCDCGKEPAKAGDASPERGAADNQEISQGSTSPKPSGLRSRRVISPIGLAPDKLDDSSPDSHSGVSP